MSIKKDEMVLALRLAGIEKGDIIFVHSSYSAIGGVEGGPDAVIDAMLEVVGEEGTLAAPAMNGGRFDAATSPSTVGIISELIRVRPNAIRSLRPCHSVAAIGKKAKELTAGHDKCETNCGEGTPFFKLRDYGAKIVLIGADMNRNTTLHGLEDMFDCRYLEDIEFEMPTYVEDFDAHKDEKMLVHKFPPGHRDFLKLTPVLRRHDAMTESVMGKALVKVIDVRKMFDICIDLMTKDNDYFLCRNPLCVDCAKFFR